MGKGLAGLLRMRKGKGSGDFNSKHPRNPDGTFAAKGFVPKAMGVVRKGLTRPDYPLGDHHAANAAGHTRWINSETGLSDYTALGRARNRKEQVAVVARSMAALADAREARQKQIHRAARRKHRNVDVEKAIRMQDAERLGPANEYIKSAPPKKQRREVRGTKVRTATARALRDVRKAQRINRYLRTTKGGQLYVEPKHEALVKKHQKRASSVVLRAWERQWGAHRKEIDVSRDPTRFKRPKKRY